MEMFPRKERYGYALGCSKHFQLWSLLEVSFSSCGSLVVVTITFQGND